MEQKEHALCSMRANSESFLIESDENEWNDEQHYGQSI
jgi:hypothetical protein